LRTFPKVQEPTRYALEWLILHASRDGEAAGAVWGEIDWRARTWTLPPDRHKAGKTATDARAHVVPLTPRAMAILEAAKQFSDSTDPKAFIFPGGAQSAKRRGMMSENTFNSLSQSISDTINGGPVTAHGFRSCFRTWAGEKTAHPREVCEAALAHTLETDVEAAYMRGEALEKRRALMNDWARFIEQPFVEIEDGSNVVTLASVRVPA
jgi:integrase